MGIDTLAMLQQSLNFTSVFVEADIYGNYDPVTGNISGVIKMVNESTVDFAISILLIDTQRGLVVKSVPILRDGHRLVYRKPGRSYSWTTFLDVFEGQHWLAYSGLLAILTLSFCIFSTATKTTPKFQRQTITFREDAFTLASFWPAYLCSIELRVGS